MEQSLFAYNLWIWVFSMENFHELYKDAKPWDQKRRRAEAGYIDLSKSQQKIQKALLEQSESFSTLKTVFVQASHDVETVEQELEELERRIEDIDNNIEQRRSTLKLPSKIK